eukprot:6527858-Prymnesium_polylepis.2
MMSAAALLPANRKCRAWGFERPPLVQYAPEALMSADVALAAFMRAHFGGQVEVQAIDACEPNTRQLLANVSHLDGFDAIFDTSTVASYTYSQLKSDGGVLAAAVRNAFEATSAI